MSAVWLGELSPGLLQQLPLPVAGLPLRPPGGVLRPPGGVPCVFLLLPLPPGMVRGVNLGGPLRTL